MQDKMKSLLSLQLERKFSTVRDLDLEAPHGGWIKNLRDVMGMTRKTLAQKVKITPQALNDIEKAEERDRISLATLRKVANALDADLKVVLVPRQPVDEILLAQARKVAARIIRDTQVHMALNQRSNSDEFLKNEIEHLALNLVKDRDRRLWEEI